MRGNLEVAARTRPLTTSTVAERVEGAFDLFPELKAMHSKRGGALSGGQQQFLAIARSFASDPLVIMMDEPTVGVAPSLVSRIGEAIGDLCRRQIGVLLVEQALELVASTASCVYFLVHGHLVYYSALGRVARFGGDGAQSLHGLMRMQLVVSAGNAEVVGLALGRDSGG